jgi:hypothetical protein
MKMTNEAKDGGGPAFPSHGSMGEVAQEGMSLRDYFAAKALQGLLAKGGNIYKKEGDELHIIPARKGIPPLAYEYADAMLAERDK